MKFKTIFRNIRSFYARDNSGIKRHYQEFEMELGAMRVTSKKIPTGVVYSDQIASVDGPAELDSGPLEIRGHLNSRGTITIKENSMLDIKSTGKWDARP